MFVNISFVDSKIMGTHFISSCLIVFVLTKSCPPTESFCGLNLEILQYSYVN
jgi:hypothetical protein